MSYEPAQPTVAESKAQELADAMSMFTAQLCEFIGSRGNMPPHWWGAAELAQQYETWHKKYVHVVDGICKLKGDTP